MITTIVQFKMSEPMSREKAQEVFSSTTPKYVDVAGLIRKYYLLSEDGCTAGGVYLWNARADAEALHTDTWRRFILEKYGVEPSVTFFKCPVVVDNQVGEIV